MNQAVKVIIAISGICTFSYGAITDYVNNGVTDPDQLSNTNYVGTAGQSAATVSGITDLTVLNSAFNGGAGVDEESLVNITSIAGSGLDLSNVGSTEITGLQDDAEKVKGGRGASVTLTQGGIRTAIANGGNAVSFSGTSSAQELNIQDGYFVGGEGGNVSGNTGNELVANGGSAVYADSGTVHVQAGLFMGGNGGVASGAGAVSLSARGGGGIDVNISTAVIAPLDADVEAAGGNGGLVDESTALLSDTTGGNALNLRWNPGSFGGNTITVNGGEYTGGSGGTSAGIDAIADGGLGMLMAGGQSVEIAEGIFTGGAGGVAVGETARADGGIGASLWFANAGAGGSLDITGGTFNGGVAGIANGEQGKEGYGLFLTANTAEISDVNVTGRGLMVNAAGLPTTTTIKSGTFSQATFTSFVPPEFSAAVPMMNVFSIEDGTFGNILVEGVAGSDGTIHAGTAENLTFRGTAENTIRLGSAFAFDDLYLGGAATNFLSISNGVTSAGNVTMQGGESTINLWSDSHFSNTSVSNGTINFNNQSFNLQSGNSFALQSQNARANFNGGATVRSGATLNLGLGRVTTTDFLAESGSSLFSTYSDNGSGGVTNGQITGDNLSFEQGLTWTLENDGSVTSSDNLLDGILLASANTTITQDLEAADIVLLDNPEWSKGITDVTNYMAGGMDNLYAIYGVLEIQDALNAEGEFGKAMEDLNAIIETDPNADFVGVLRGWSEAEAQNNLHESYVRTPEVANVLIGMQSVFADQIKDRTGSFRQLSGFAGGAAPQGAAGPEDWYDNSVDWMREHMPSWDGRDAARDVSDAAPVPPIHGDPSEVGKSYTHGTTGKGGDYDAIVDAVHSIAPDISDENIEVPATYQVWGRGYGSSLDQHSTKGHVGYDATIGGGMMGVDKRFENILLGLGGGYAHTILNGSAGNDAKADTGHAVGYFSANGEHAYFDANINYALSAVDTDGLSDLAYEAEYDAHSVGFYVGGGFGIPAFNDKAMFTPEVSLLTTYFNRESFTETSDLGSPDKKYDSYDQWSYLSALGATLSMIQHIESFNLEMEFQPELRAHWLHEFNSEMDDDSYKMMGVPGGGQDIGVALQAREEDLIKLGAGVRFSKWQSDTTEFGVDLDGVFGEDYEAFILSGKVMHRF